MILALIHNRYRDMTKTEQKIASFVLENYERISEMSVKEVALDCGTVPSAVIRFCKTMGFSGFPELKILLAKESEREKKEQTVRMPAFSAADSEEEVFRKVFASGVKTLRDTLAMLDFKRLGEIVGLLARSRRIFVFGTATSSIVAMDAQYRFSQLGLNVTACTDGLFMNVTAANCEEGDVVLAISHSGRTKIVIDAMRRAKARGARTVAVTSFSDSLLAKECDYSVCVFADEENYPVEAVSARMAHLCLIDAFMMTLATLNYPEFEKHIFERNKILSEIRY